MIGINTIGWMKSFKWKSVLIYVLLAYLPFILQAQDKSQFLKKDFVYQQDTLKYRILYPEQMKEGKQYPLVLFLHGSGERGDDNEKQLTHGANLFLNSQSKHKYPAIVVFPQCPNDVMWTHRMKQKNKDGVWEFEFPLSDAPAKPAFLVDKLVDEFISSGKVKEEKVYIMGLWMGGIGTLDFLCRWPDKYAAAVVICGGHDPSLVSRYADVPIWFFHGAKDDVVPPKYSKQVFDELQKQGSKVKYTLYPDANHNSWDVAFKEPDYLKWVFKQKIKCRK